MKLALYQIDAFTDRLFGGNPACVVPLTDEVLGKKDMIALQLSDRVGKLYCVEQEESVLIAAHARTCSIGECWTE